LRASLDEQLHDAEADLCGAACGGGGGGGGNRRPRFPIAASLPARTSAVQMVRLSQGAQCAACGVGVQLGVTCLELARARRGAAASLEPPGPPRPLPPLQGSSVPIAIPSLPRWKPGATCQPGSAGEGAPFVPPHEMAGAAGGDIAASPSAVLKRERLRARNAILRSTGFLEPKDGPSGGAFSSGGGGGGGASGVGGGAAPGVAHSLPAGGGGLARLEARFQAAVPPAAQQKQSSLTAALTTIGEAT
jgi:hypothetical protein